MTVKIKKTDESVLTEEEINKLKEFVKDSIPVLANSSVKVEDISFVECY